MAALPPLPSAAEFDLSKVTLPAANPVLTNPVVFTPEVAPTISFKKSEVLKSPTHITMRNFRSCKSE